MNSIFKINLRKFVVLMLIAVVSACGSGSGSSEPQSKKNILITTFIDGNGAGSISPEFAEISQGNRQSFNLIPRQGSRLENIWGCGGTLNGLVYTTSTVQVDCEVKAIFVPDLYRVTTVAGENGSFNISSTLVRGSATVKLIPDAGYVVDRVEGCGGVLEGLDYTTAVITENCTITASFKLGSTLELSLSDIKTFTFKWSETPNATHYQIFEALNAESGFSQIGTDITKGVGQYDYIVPLYEKLNARYLLKVCSGENCIERNIVETIGNLEEAIGYVKASNTDKDDKFGQFVKISSDGKTLAVSAIWEKSSAKGIDGDQTDNSYDQAGAVYVFAKEGQEWVQQAYLKASNTDPWDAFGLALDISEDGSTLAISATGEDSRANEINGDSNDNSGSSIGAVYLFSRSDGIWSQEAYIKPRQLPPVGHTLGFGEAVALNGSGSLLAVGSEWGVVNGIASGSVSIFAREESSWNEIQLLSASNAGHGDHFGDSLAFSDDGNVLVVGAPNEDSKTSLVNGNQEDNSATNSGAAYVFTRNESAWIQDSYLKASNTSEERYFGGEVSVSGDGKVIAVGVYRDNGSGVDSQYSNSLPWSGAVHVFEKIDSVWSRVQYLKASNAGQEDRFGTSVSLNFNGDTLAIGASSEDGDAIGIAEPQSKNYSLASGAVYVFRKKNNHYDQISYLKAKSSGQSFALGFAVDINKNGDTIVVGAPRDSSGATGVGGDHLDASAKNSGAVLIY